MRSGVRVASFFATFALALWSRSPSARAQGNYRLAPVGGRTTLVGGTGLAYGADGASTFLNPATAVRVDDSRLSFSVNFYTMNFTYAPSWYKPGTVDEARFGQLDAGSASLADLEFNVLPSSLCLYFRIGEVRSVKDKEHTPDYERLRASKLGLCFASIQGSHFGYAAGQYDNTSSTGAVTRHAQTVAQTYDRFAFGPTFAFSLSDNFAVGASVHASFASHRSIFSATANTYGGGVPSQTTSIFTSGARGDSFQGTATLGMWWRLGLPTLALAFESPSLHLYGIGAANLTTHFEAAGTGTTSTSVRGSFTSKSPMRVSLGGGIEDHWGSGELNVSYYFPQSSAYSAVMEGRVLDRAGGAIDDPPTRAVLSQRTAGVVSVGIGGEVYVTPKLSFLGGASTDLSAVPEGALAGTLMNYFSERTHRVAGAFGIGSHGEGGDLLFGTELSLGWGDRLAVNSYQLPPALSTTAHNTVQLLFVVAGSTSLKSITRAVRDVRQVISEPAK